MNNKFNALKSEENENGTEEKFKEFSPEPILPRKKPPPVKDGDHLLEYHYTLWFSRKSPGKQSSSSVSYNSQLKCIMTFASIEQFWLIYSHVARPHELSGHCDYHLFKDGIKPMWEDEANVKGGKWMIRLKKGLISRCWENLILAVLGEQFIVGNEICGAVASMRYQEDILSLWNRTASNNEVTSKIRETLKRVLNIPQNTIMEYKAHTDSIKDNSSYRNTDVFVK
ncbi:DgyrCDS5525 [Dimorphilus gyrociliatus]|uniref:DgyrCDS5525 n=1 Tax=Dimorphilus gyrociliatus TaxID=2664684 RepID=A0A7I8VK55_9ANNE|nr:DgyrCDS5525 [Dimorphilus gyrociliatus]